MIVTIDGPAGAGKSRVAQALAERLGFRYLDTGATYRAVTWAAIQQGIPWDDTAALANLARTIQIEFEGDRVLVEGRDVTAEIRSGEVTASVRHVADLVEVRSVLVNLQREIASGADYVTEGRDQGTVAFPDADCKFFVTASPEERARRRLGDLEAQGESITLDEVLRQQNLRDRQDETRPVGGLHRAADAVEVVTDGLALEQVVDRLERLVRDKLHSTDSAAT